MNKKEGPQAAAPHCRSPPRFAVPKILPILAKWKNGARSFITLRFSLESTVATNAIVVLIEKGRDCVDKS